MWKPVANGLFCAALLTGCGEATAPGSKSVPTNPALKSGIDFSQMDTSVKPQDDIYLYAVGSWEKETEIPADKPLYTTYMEVRDRMDEAVQSIVKKVASAPDLKPATSAFNARWIPGEEN